MDFIRNRGRLSCRFLLDCIPGQSLPSTFEWLNSPLDTNYIYQTALWPNMWKCYRDFLCFLFLGSSEWRQFVQLMSDNHVSDMLIQLQESVWYEKMTPVTAYFTVAQQHIQPHHHVHVYDALEVCAERGINIILLFKNFLLHRESSV